MASSLYEILTSDNPSKECGWDVHAQLGHYHREEWLAMTGFAAFVVVILASAAGLLLNLHILSWIPEAFRRGIFLAAGIGSACILQGMLIEPFRMTVRHVRIKTGKVKGRPIRIAHISDIHTHRWGAVEEKLIRKLRQLKPDFIAATGDFTSFPPIYPEARKLITELMKVAPAYCVRGDRELEAEADAGLLDDSDGLWLRNKTRDIEIAGTRMALTGCDAGSEAEIFSLGRAVHPERLSVLLYHYPDYAHVLETLPYDVALHGHTHGGQIRLPLIGALIAQSRAGTDYTRGLSRKAGKAVFISQGIGCESFGLPRMRFLCPPEIALIELA